jgi:hypothetical protein
VEQINHLSADEQRAHDAFAASVSRVGSGKGVSESSESYASHASQPVFYSPAAVAALGEVFSAMRVVLCPPLDPKVKVKALKKGETAPEPHMPEAWDGRVDTLRSFAAKV